MPEPRQPRKFGLDEGRFVVPDDFDAPMAIVYEDARATSGRYRLLLAKEDFKFACAHFTLFGADRAELLHGHNYKVRVEVAADRLDEHGLLLDIAPFKAAIRRECAELDEQVLVPAESPLLAIGQDGDELEIRFGSRRYRLPAADVLLLPLVNSSMELLAEWLWRRLAPELVGTPVDTLTVAVEESAGQRCLFERRLTAGPVQSL